MDLNSLTATKIGGFNGLSHTGTVVLTADGNSSMNGLLIDGTDQAGFNGVLADFQGTIDLANGVVTGGAFTITLASGAVYHAMVKPVAGSVQTAAGLNGPFTIDEFMRAGEFNGLEGGTDFGNVDVSFWNAREPLDNGSFLLQKLDGAGGTDDDVDIDLFVVAEDRPPEFCKEHEPNDFCDTRNVFGVDCEMLQGLLEERLVPGPQPDTWLCVVDKQDNILAQNDNGAMGIGNGKGSGLWAEDIDDDGWADLLVVNGDGSASLRLIVTGFPDGFDGNCNGFFQNAPHGQIGEWCLTVEYINDAGDTLRTDTYTDEFITGAEAFRVNFTAPDGATNVHIEIDNTCGREVVCVDRDFICFEGLDPLVAYCITVVSGLDSYCEPTDTVLGWFDKNCNLIRFDDDSGPNFPNHRRPQNSVEMPIFNSGYSELCVVADVNGVITFGVTGKGDFDFDGFNDQTLRPHGVCGTYMLLLRRADGDPVTPPVVCPAAVTEAALMGDINMDGVVDTVDLVTLISNWCMLTIVPAGAGG